MGNIGRPSGGCFTCKERKVKVRGDAVIQNDFGILCHIERSDSCNLCIQCDEEKPTCKKCRLSKRTCKGYRDTWQTFHREENFHVAQLVHTRVTKKLKERQQRATEPTIPRQVQPDQGTMILNHFYRDYSEDSGIAFFSMLPAISSATPADCFLDALKATALASSSRQLTQCGLMVQARSHYGRAIMGLNDALKNPTVGQDDSVMAALFILGLFEVSRVTLSSMTQRDHI